MQDRFLGFLGLLLKAGHVTFGDERVTTAVQSGKGCLILLANDSAPRLVRRMEVLADEYTIKKHVLPYSKEQLGQAVGSALCGTVCVTDVRTANAVIQKMQKMKLMGGKIE